MSPTYYAVQEGKLNAELEAARLRGDFPGMQASLAGLTSLLRGMYGRPQAQV
ncbi:hypothetical protein [Bradyrhizobium centrolobii]|uniref:hypothetical protein n=1 Tax=Bradyrhizobium centrolobii TaxID=1505087 RepID=UPI000B0236A4|nr:hypothetical protein [Bradyrhizobium centrolobii]